MQLTPETFDFFLQAQMPIAHTAGVKLDNFENNKVVTSVTFGRMNQNPFGSMFWAVQGMAAEFAGGIMLLTKIQATGTDVSMLVIKNENQFFKKAKGKILFTCDQGELIDAAVQKAIASGESEEMILVSEGVNEEDEIVGRFRFTWSIKKRS